jgi:hypothetical protein
MPSKSPKPIGPKKKSATKKAKGFKSVENWEKKSSGTWTSGQSRALNPGSTGAVTKRNSGRKYKALGKKVIRPRVRKQHTTKER